MIAEALGTMALGMAGIFVVMGIIIGSIAAINRLFNRKKDGGNS